MNAVDDVTLLQLAREPDAELVPSGRRVAGLKPLIVLLAFVPSLLAFRHFAPGDVASADGLRALRLVSGSRVEPVASALPLKNVAAKSEEMGLAASRITPLDGLTALCLRLVWLTPESRLLLVSYFSSVALLLCLAVLVRQTSGVRVELIAVLLASFHPEILGMSGHLPTTTLAVAMALLASCGIIRHQAGKYWLSWSLLGAGVAWGLSRLISESLTSATGCLLVAQCLMRTRSPVVGVISASRSPGWGDWLLRSLTCLIVVVLMMSLTVTAWDLALLKPIGRWSDWPNRWMSGLNAFATLSWPRELSFGEVCRETLETCGPLLGFTLLGLADAIHAQFRRDRDEPLDGDLFLVVWWCLSGLMAVLNWSSYRGEFSVPAGQPLYWLMSSLVLAARGIDGVIQRQYGLEVVLWVSGLSVFGAFLSPNWLSQLGLSGRDWLVVIVISILVIGAVSWMLRRSNWSAGWQRRSLLTCLAVTLISAMSWGLSSLPPPATDERELSALRLQIGTDQKPDEAVLICDDQPPSRLLFFIQSLCPNSEVSVISEWKSARTEPESQTDAKQLIFSWGSHRSLPMESRREGRRLVPVSTPHVFQGRSLRAFRWTLRTVGRHQTPSLGSETRLVGQP